MTLVAEKLRTALPQLPRAERRVAYEILASYPSAGLETVARLANRAEVSGPTVIRLISRLGYQGFPDFQEALIHEIQERTASPLQNYAKRGEDAPIDALEVTVSTVTEALTTSLGQMDRGSFDAAVQLLTDGRRRCMLVGGRFSGTLAQSLAHHLEILRPNIRFLSPSEWVSYLLDARKGDVVLAIDFRRYQESTISFGQECVKRGASLLVITDPWFSPLAMDADVALPVSVQSASPFDSQVPALTLIEALVGGVVEARGREATDRVADYDSLWASQGFTPSGIRE